MKDPWNPKKEELRKWAYDPESKWPDQDFDLSVTEIHFSELILECAIDENCPKKDFFLSCAYILVGDAVRSGFNSTTKENVQDFLKAVKITNNKNLLLLFERATKLIKNPLLFDYDLWCAEGFVRKDKQKI